MNAVDGAVAERLARLGSAGTSVDDAALAISALLEAVLARCGRSQVSSLLPNNRRRKRRTKTAEAVPARLERVGREVTSALRGSGAGSGVLLANVASAVVARVAACEGDGGSAPSEDRIDDVDETRGYKASRTYQSCIRHSCRCDGSEEEWSSCKGSPCTSRRHERRRGRSSGTQRCRLRESTRVSLGGGSGREGSKEPDAGLTKSARLLLVADAVRVGRDRLLARRDLARLDDALAVDCLVALVAG